MRKITPDEYIFKKGWFCYCSKKDGSKAFKISEPFEKLSDSLKKEYIKSCDGEIIFNHWSFFL